LSKRVSTLVKKLGLEEKFVVDRLIARGHDVRSSTSLIDQDVFDKFVDEFGKKTVKKPTVKKATAKKKIKTTVKKAAKPKPKAEAAEKPKPKAEAKPKAKAKPKPKPESKPKPKAEVKPKATPKPEAKPKPEKAVGPKVEPEQVAAVAKKVPEKPKPEIKAPSKKIDTEELEQLDELEKEKLVSAKAEKTKKVHSKKRIVVLRHKQPVVEAKEKKPVVKEQTVKVLEFDRLPEVRSLAKRIKIKARHVVKKLADLGINLTEKDQLDPETAEIIAHEYDYEVKFNFELPKKEDKEENLEPRPPVITFMGHVDHGKTTLMDYIRKSSVVDGEAGGITQHIGAYKVKVNDNTIVFLDTPGHEAFTSMRARGAKVTDICVLVIAADDGVMPQTIEAINHAKAAEAQIVVAINKIDRPGAEVDRVKQQLMTHELIPEGWGGDIICVPVSALNGDGVDDLVEMLTLQSEMLELKANPDKPARGVIIESSLSTGRGSVTTAMIQEGTLRIGDIALADTFYGRIRAMNDEKGNRLTEAGPSTPVELMGLNGVPAAGADISVVGAERIAREIAQTRIHEARMQSQTLADRVNLEDFLSAEPEAEKKQLKIIIKADVQGSLEALKGSIAKIPSDKIEMNVVHSGVGDITESDIMLASASNAAILGFQVKSDPQLEEQARKGNVKMFFFDVIYRAIDEVRLVMEENLEPLLQERVTGKATVKQLFASSALGTIAGCYVTEGVVVRNGKVRITRNGENLFEGEIASLRRYQEEAREMRAGQECGIKVKGFNNVAVDDVFEIFVIDKIAQKL
jgi:translation initiation factor IF-2